MINLAKDMQLTKDSDGNWHVRYMRNKAEPSPATNALWTIFVWRDKFASWKVRACVQIGKDLFPSGLEHEFACEYCARDFASILRDTMTTVRSAQRDVPSIAYEAPRTTQACA